ncbi:MAG: hypothetical protein R3E01_30870 [Pirellulaceae bacterium]
MHTAANCPIMPRFPNHRLIAAFLLTFCFQGLAFADDPPLALYFRYPYDTYFDIDHATLSPDQQLVEGRSVAGFYSAINGVSITGGSGYPYLAEAGNGVVSAFVGIGGIDDQSVNLSSKWSLAFDWSDSSPFVQLDFAIPVKDLTFDIYDFREGTYPGLTTIRLRNGIPGDYGDVPASAYYTIPETPEIDGNVITLSTGPQYVTNVELYMSPGEDRTFAIDNIRFTTLALPEPDCSFLVFLTTVLCHARRRRNDSFKIHFANETWQSPS